MKKTALVLLMIGAFSQILGFSRELLLSYFYGITPIADAYQLVVTLQNFLISFVITSFSLNYISYFKKAKKEIGIQHANKLTNTIFSSVTIFVLLVVLGVYLNLNNIINILGPGLNEETKVFTLNFAKVTIFSTFFCAISYMLTAYLHAHEKFNGAAFIGYPMNFILIFSIIISAYFGELYLVYGFLIAYIFQFILLIFLSYKNGFRFKFKIDLNDKYFKGMILAALPIFFVTISYEMNTLVDKAMATQESIGGVAIITYSERLIGAVYTLIALPIITVIFPKIADLSVEKEYKEIGNLIRKISMNFILFLLPICIYLYIISEEAIELIYGRGSFELKAVSITAEVFGVAVIGVFFWAFRDMCLRVYYALGSYKFVISVSFVSVLTNLCLNLVLIDIYGLKGIALATTFNMAIVAVLLTIRLQYVIGNIINMKFLVKGIKILFLNVLISYILMEIKDHLGFYLIYNMIIILLIYLIILVTSLELLKITKISKKVLKKMKRSY